MKEGESKVKELRVENRPTTKSGKKSFPCAYCEQNFLDNNECQGHFKIEHKDEYISILENKLKESEAQLSKLVRDSEKLKVENKEFKTIRTLSGPTAKNSPGDTYDKEDEIELDSEKELLAGKHKGFRRVGPQVQPEKLVTCLVCGFKLKDQANLDRHLKKHEDSRKICSKCGETFSNEVDFDFHNLYEHTELFQWNCMKCAFQANSRDHLKTHINFKHTKETDKEVIDCDKCNRQFRSTWHLRNHTRDDHGKEEECSFYKDNKCKFGNKCWKVHSENSDIKTFTCYSCKETFKNINELMGHRKKNHIELVKFCEPKQGICRFESQPERCWFKHKDFSQATRKQGPP